MNENFSFDVFLSHSSKDKAVVRPLAERLRQDGLKVWFHEWEVKPGDSLSSGERARVRAAKFEEGLELSRKLEHWMSARVFGVDRAYLNTGPRRMDRLPFRDPLSQTRCFVPNCFDDAPIKDELAQQLAKIPTGDSFTP